MHTATPALQIKIGKCVDGFRDGIYLLFVLILTARIAFKRSAQHSTLLNVVGSNPMWNNTIRSTNGCSQSGYSLYPFHVLL